jgi:hypothetical protein
MSIWQLGFIAVPSNASNQVAVIGEFDDSILWREFKESEELCNDLDMILPRYSTWSQDILGWGEENQDRVHLTLDQVSIIGFSFRLDLRSLNLEFIKNISSLANKFNLIFVSSEGDLVSPSDEGVLEYIKKSRNWRIISNDQTES